MPFLAWVGLALAAVLGAWGVDEGCASCTSDFGDQAEVEQWLGAQGYSAADYEILFTWTETGMNQSLVYGYRLKPRAGGEPFDVYGDASGALLGVGELSALGIHPKSWGAIAVETDAEVAVGAVAPVAPEPKMAALKARPAALPLEALDLGAVAKEDAARTGPEKAVVRTGVFRVFPKALSVQRDKASLGGWLAVPGGGGVWAATIVSPDAVGQRVHFSTMTLPAGGYVLVYNADDPKERYGPFTGIPASDGDFWSPTCFGEAVTVEVFVPDGGAVDVRMDRIVHMYKRLDEVAWGGAKTPAGACNLDAACYADWLTTAAGVGGLATIGGTGSLWCTGTLVVDTDPTTQIPYLLTANHCVPAGHAPSTVEVYWLYQRDSCGGTVPTLASVPRTTGGTDLMASSAANRPSWTGTDFTLLRLRNAPPPGVTYVGWSAVTYTVGEPTTCIHHPSGDYKRITFGTYTNDIDECFLSPPAPPAAKYYQSTWSEGTTEGGSSGSPLLRDSDQRIIGQLWGGYASCSKLTCPDYYGRFDVSFPMMAAYLNPGGASRTFDFTVEAVSIGEGDGGVVVTVQLSAPPAGAEVVQVAYATADGSATAGADYAATSGVLTFGEFQTTATISVPILEEGQIEEAETLTIVLSGPIGGTLAGANNPITVNILDNDVDTDGDSLSDYDEIQGTYGYITDSNNPDTDGDGISDWLEITFGFDPTDADQYPSISSLRVPFFEE